MEGSLNEVSEQSREPNDDFIVEAEGQDVVEEEGEGVLSAQSFGNANGI